jgi:hypothetical protein
MVGPEAASIAVSSLTHILLNSGESRCYLNEGVSRRTMAITDDLMRRGGVVISRSLGTYATLHHGRGGLVLTLGRNSLPLTVSALAIDPSGSDLWEWLMISHKFFRANVPGYRIGQIPERPQATPRMATVELPYMASHVSPKTAERLHGLAGELGVALAFAGAGK